MVWAGGYGGNELPRNPLSHVYATFIRQLAGGGGWVGSVKQHGGFANYVLSADFYGENWWTIGGTNVKFPMEIEQKFPYKFCKQYSS